jgi:hypothetical protein
MTALDALAHVPAMDEEIGRLRARLASLDEEQDDLHALLRETPAIYTEDRAAFLRTLFTVRDLIFDDAGMRFADDGGGSVLIGTRMTLAHAAAFLGVTDDDLASFDLAVLAGRPFPYETTDGVQWDVEADTVLTEDVLLALLRRLPRDRLRRILRLLGVTVEVTRPRTRAEWAQYGATPIEDRVRVLVHDGALILNPCALRHDRVRHDVENVKMLSKG